MRFFQLVYSKVVTRRRPCHAGVTSFIASLWPGKYGPAMLVILVLSFILQGTPVPAFERRTPVVEAIAIAGPAVVNIRTEQIIKRRSSPFFGFSDPFFEEFFRSLVPPRTYTTQSLGSGVIIDPQGYILTNAHVIEKASRIFVALPDSQKELEAELVGMAERLDLAVLKVVAAKEYPFIPPGRSDNLMIGETVIAIGNPLGLGHSVTTGIISAQRRRIPVGNGFVAVFIQTDALINPGNSGGPLININGELIGINTAIASQAQGIGFAIPIDTAKKIASDLIRYGRVRKAYIGIVSQSVGKKFSESHGEGGILVKEVDPGSPAARAGIRFGDVILALDEVPVASPAEFVSILETYTQGDRARLHLLRGMDTQAVEVTLTEPPRDYGLRYGERVFGLVVKDSRQGAMVRKVIPDSSAARAGIRPGDLVMEIAGERITRIADFGRIVEAHMGREPLRFLVVRGKRGYYVDLP
ncbi:MAG: trypsin-like peptidase domain-containing protein [Desulfobacterales bacterium]|nr:trypsin-like peptidase domain-containing protein [Desulfobacterales bacterium]